MAMQLPKLTCSANTVDGDVMVTPVRESTGVRPSFGTAKSTTAPPSREPSPGADTATNDGDAATAKPYWAARVKGDTLTHALLAPGCNDCSERASQSGATIASRHAKGGAPDRGRTCDTDRLRD